MGALLVLLSSTYDTTGLGFCQVKPKSETQVRRQGVIYVALLGKLSADFRVDLV